MILICKIQTNCPSVQSSLTEMPFLFAVQYPRDWSFLPVTLAHHCASSLIWACTSTYSHLSSLLWCKINSLFSFNNKCNRRLFLCFKGYWCFKSVDAEGDTECLGASAVFCSGSKSSSSVLLQTKFQQPAV